MSYIHPEREAFLPDEVRFPTRLDVPDFDAEADKMIAHIDSVDLPVPPWTKPGHPDYSWDPAARPAIPAEGSEVQMRQPDCSQCDSGDAA